MTQSNPSFISLDSVEGLQINSAACTETAQRVLDKDVLRLLVRLHRELEPERQKLLAARKEWQREFDSGRLPDYLDRNSLAVTGDWRVAPIPADLMRRRVEITGPINSAKMVINMLSRNAQGDRADTAMLDFEDSMKPAWNNVIVGLDNLIGVVDGTLAFRQPGDKGQPEKSYRVEREDMAVIMVRVRGLHLDESNIRIDGNPVSGGLLDFTASFYHAARKLIEQGKTPKYYVPKCEHYLEARWWNRLFTMAQEALGIPRGTMRATFLIETLPAAFEMEEILYEIREHAAGLNVGRWDKIFSDIKVLRNHPDRILADRGSINLTRPWMLNYARRLIKICHSRGAFAMGGMAAFTPGKTPEMVAVQSAKVAEDKQLEANIGHDGCWVSHPYFIGCAMSEFKRDHQLDMSLDYFDKYPDLMPRLTPPRTMAGLRKNVRVGIGYMNGWNQDIGCVAWDDLMEDLATLEISRAQVWQWLHHKAVIDESIPVTSELVRKVFAEELDKIFAEAKESMAGISPKRIDAVLDGFRGAAKDAERIFLQEQFAEFLTLSSELAR